MVMEKFNFIPEDQIARYDAMGNPVAKPNWHPAENKRNTLVNETVDNQLAEILQGEFIINSTVDTQIEEIMEKVNF